MKMDTETLNTCFAYLSSEARELHIDSSIPILDHPPSALEFYREYVAANKPVVFRGLASHWPACHLWDSDYFRQKIGQKEVTVAVTPNGYADAVCDGKFVMPAEQRMPFADFLDIIESKSPNANGVYYVQKQNSNLTDEFVELADDVESHIAWTTEALGAMPDAVNFWMGSGKAITSMHKDHYENIYCVISGSKTFILIPPADQPFVPYELYQQAVYTPNASGTFDIVDTDSQDLVPWIAIDPLNPDLDRYPQYRHARPLEVTICAGDALFLPSLWFHHVRQSHGCIAVNYWYDMAYDIRYTYFKFVETLLNRSKKQTKKKQQADCNTSTHQQLTDSSSLDTVDT